MDVAAASLCAALHYPLDSVSSFHRFEEEPPIASVREANTKLAAVLGTEPFWLEDDRVLMSLV